VTGLFEDVEELTREKSSWLGLANLETSVEISDEFAYAGDHTGQRDIDRHRDRLGAFGTGG
jgi:hypothetical protein